MNEELMLLPCPVCGGEGDIIDNFERDNKSHVVVGWFAYCEKGCLATRVRGSREEAAALWNALPRALTWTNKPPKRPGWYWCRDAKGKIRLHQLENFVGGPRLFVCGISKHIFPDELTDRQWAGPIPEPREPK